MIFRSTSRFAWALIAFWSFSWLACGGLQSHGNCDPADGGTGGGTGGGFSTGGGTATGGGSANGGGVGTGGGSSTGGGGSGSATGGGSGTGGGGASTHPFQYSELAMPITTGSYIDAIAGRPGEVWATTEYGHVLRKTDAGFVDLPGSWTSSLNGLYVAPDGAVMVLSNREAWGCPGPCNGFADFALQTVGSSTTDMNALCGTSFTDIYAIGNRDNESIGVLWHWDGVTWTQLSDDLGITSPGNCFMRSDGVMWITGVKDVVRWEQGAATIETLDLDLTVLGSSADSQQWYGVGGFGDNIYAVGGYHRVIGRDSNGHWTLVSNPPQQQSNFYVIAPVTPTELFAGGYAFGSGEVMWWHSDGGTWVASSPDLPFVDGVRAAYVAGPNEMYLGGDDGNFAPLILRATR